MADSQLQSQKVSSLSQSMGQVLKTDLSYNIPENYPICGTHKIPLNPSNPTGATDPSGKSLQWSIPSYGNVKNMVIESRLTNSANNNAAANDTDLGARIFDSISLKSHGSVICQNSLGYSTVRQYDASLEKSLAASELQNSPTTLTTGAVATFFTPVYFPFFEKVENSIDTSFVENLELVANVTTDFRLATGSIASAEFILWIEYFTLDTKDHQELLARNFVPGKNLNMLLYDSESQTSDASSVTSLTVDIKNNNLCFATHFFIQDTATGVLAPITSYTLSVDGRVVRNGVPRKIEAWTKASRGHRSANITQITSGAITDKLTVKPVSCYWGLEGNRTWKSGAINFRATSNPTLTVNLASATNKRLVIVQEFWRLMSIDSVSGIINLGVSS